MLREQRWNTLSDNDVLVTEVTIQSAQLSLFAKLILFDFDSLIPFQTVYAHANQCNVIDQEAEILTDVTLLY